MKRFSELLTAYQPALRWWLMFCAMCVGLFFSWQAGIVQDFFRVDQTYISFIIFGIFSVFTAMIGTDTYKICKGKPLDKICARVQVGWFFSDAVITLGMLGTVAGFIMMLSGDITAAKTALASMSRGMGVALYTTAAGVATGLLLKLQLFNLSMCLDKLTEDSNSCKCKE